VCDPHAATLRDRLREGRIASFDGGACTFVSFQFRPGLGRLDEAAQLLEQGAGGCAFAVELFDPAGPYFGLLPLVFEPYVRDLSVHRVALGAPDDRTRELGKRFSNSVRSHFLGMRDDAFVAAVARELAKHLQAPPSECNYASGKSIVATSGK